MDIVVWKMGLILLITLLLFLPFMFHQGRYRRDHEELSQGQDETGENQAKPLPNGASSVYQLS